MERRRTGAAPAAKGIREAELETLLASPDQMGEDRPDGVFYARSVVVPTRRCAQAQLDMLVESRQVRRLPGF